MTATGEPIFYSGSKLAADLSLPRLLRRWGSQPARLARETDDVLAAARGAVERARRVVADGDAG